MILAFNGKTPAIGANVFIAPTAMVIGDVTIGDGSSIWYGTVLRGDMAPIRIGAETNIQDLTMVHTDYGHPAILGDRVSVGHRAVVHGCRVDDEALVGIGAVVLNGAVVGRGSVVAAGAVVREGQQVTAGVLVAQVQPGSSAEDAGLQRGDIILRVGTKEVKTKEEFWTALNGALADMPHGVPLRVRRGNVSTTLTLQAAADEEKK